MRLRRFLMTEPTETSLSQWLGVVGDGHPGTGTEKMPRISLANSEALAARAYGTERRASADVGYRSLQSIGHRGFRNPETATEANGWQAVAEGKGVTERSPALATRLAAQRRADSRAGGAS